MVSRRPRGASKRGLKLFRVSDEVDMFEEPSLEEQTEKQPASDGAHKATVRIECLGMKFETENARRAYFLDRLREKLNDATFRQQPGFPLGSDEDILRLSDPPYYTACPNPFLPDFVRYYGKPYDPSVQY